VEVFGAFLVFSSDDEVMKKITWSMLYNDKTYDCWSTTWIASICKCWLNISKPPFCKNKICTIVRILFVVARDDQFTIVHTKLCFVFVNVGG